MAKKLEFQTGMKTTKIVKVTRRKGYQIVKMLIDDREYGGKGDLPMTCAFNEKGQYIGDPKTARRLVEKFGIKPELRPGASVCTIGYSSRRRKWYGWSHRAIAGFGLGSTVKPGDVIVGRFKAGYKPKTMADCRRMAMRFASEVS